MISEVITIDDEDDDDPITEMKLNLHETYLKYKESVDLSSPSSVVITSPSYSPSQPVCLSPDYIPPSIESGSVLSPTKSSYQFVDLTSPYSPTDRPTTPPLPPLPPPASSLSPLPPLPPPSPSVVLLPEPVPTTLLSRLGEPLPPGEDLDPSSPARAVEPDMEIETCDDPESIFFLSQQKEENLFPTSVWGFSSQPPPPPRPPRFSRDEDTNEDDNTDRKRKNDDDDELEEGQISQEDTNSNENDEDTEEEESLRSLLLAQVKKSDKKIKISNENIKEHESKIASEEIEKSANSSKELSLLKEIDKSTPKFKKVKLKAGRSPKNRNLSEAKPKKLNKKLKSKPVKISEADQRKYFPNLSKKVVVNFLGNDSDSEEEESKSVSNKNPSMSDNFFGLDLEAFLKQARNSSVTTRSNKTNMMNIEAGEKEKQKVVVKKIALTPQLKAKASELTLEHKKKLISAKISHLSRSKQLEYQRLKEILAKKQKEKATRMSQKVTPTLDASTQFSKSNSISEEEEEALRHNLIQNMMKKASIKGEKSKSSKLKDTKGVDMKTKSSNTPVSQIEGSKNETLNTLNIKPPVKKSKQKQADDTLKQSPQKSVTNKSAMSIEIAGDSREVKLNGKICQDENENEEGNTDESKKGTELKALENDVVEMRKGLSASLFKLSAYMSQLQKETHGVESAFRYIEELKKQLKEAEKLVFTREKKVDNLKEVIRESHKSITVQKHAMTQKEDECRNVGCKMLGDEYKPPIDGAENIRKKLEMIRNTAMKVKTTSYSSDSGPGGQDSGNYKVGGDKVVVVGDYRSPLEHLSQTNKHEGLDHSKELCRFDLTGKCLDETCQLQHIGDI